MSSLLIRGVAVVGFSFSNLLFPEGVAPEVTVSQELYRTDPGHQRPPETPTRSVVGGNQLPTPVQKLVAATVEADSNVGLNATPCHQSRRPSVVPNSSGGVDGLGRKRPSRIRTPEKRGLIELAATMCHTHWLVRGKGKFIAALYEAWKKNNRKISEDAITKLLDCEMKQRDEEIAADDTSGRDVRHGTYFDHLDVLREHAKGFEALAVENRGKRKKKATAQQTTKQGAKNNLARSYSLKQQTIELSDDDSGDSEAFEGEEEGTLAVDSGDLSISSSQRTTRPNSTLRRAKKKQRKEKGLSLIAISKSINRLARTTEDGGADLATAMRSGNLGDELNLKQLVENSQRETAERLEAFEKALEERQKATDEKIERILGLLAAVAKKDGA
ncbi:hypothetical protein K469DRAFT_751509 [Zopfia rhizophila CBS 207.26]|uniref:Uncharacterized protein n=1 Tax=Zopfia rhizophila CBS 207.26 TaxID=1314779 RepID=A0A6A6DUZ7_9PEZI|nr:hypothetical protein K469DRAFT_751509 [Zopfia rhizophila CBS 207.26]